MVVGLEEAGPTYFPPFSTDIPHNVGEEVADGNPTRVFLALVCLRHVATDAHGRDLLSWAG